MQFTLMCDVVIGDVDKETVSVFSDGQGHYVAQLVDQYGQVFSIRNDETSDTVFSSRSAVLAAAIFCATNLVKEYLC